MSKPSRRPQRDALKAQRRKKKQQEKVLRVRQIAEGFILRTPPALPNTCSAYATVAQEQQAREEAVTGQLAVLRRALAGPRAGPLPPQSAFPAPARIGPAYFTA